MPNLERVRGIEPPYPAWEAGVLPLNYTREIHCVCYFTTLAPYMQALFWKENGMSFHTIPFQQNISFALFLQIILYCGNIIVVILGRHYSGTEA
jgi:hypothetical protein